MKKISWLEQFANDYDKKLKKTASKIKIANQIIVDCAEYPNAKVGSLVDYKEEKYKVVDTDFHDKIGPGILLEKIAEGEDMMPDGEVPMDGEVQASVEEDDDDSKNCGDKNCGDGICKAAAEDVELEVADIENAVDSLMDGYPSTVKKPGGVKPIQSDANIGPGKKKVTDAPYHPTYDPGEEYAMDCPDDFQDAADKTADAINQEDAQDRTTVEGHYTWNQNMILDRVVSDAQEEMEAESFVDEELPELEELPEEPKEETEDVELPELPEEPEEPIDEFEDVDLPEDNEDEKK